MKKIIIAFAIISLMAAGCNTFNNCTVISEGMYKGKFRACIECDTTNHTAQKKLHKN